MVASWNGDMADAVDRSVPSVEPPRRQDAKKDKWFLVFLGVLASWRFHMRNRHVNSVCHVPVPRGDPLECGVGHRFLFFGLREVIRSVFLNRLNKAFAALPARAYHVGLAATTKANTDRKSVV